ncbi:hypothetical protein C8R44DRAFT_725780 [Mycena epipterygia]|nr:hypothetical protein C8R44DRAFT_725780 [Mycena epipterygia]
MDLIQSFKTRNEQSSQNATPNADDIMAFYKALRDVEPEKRKSKIGEIQSSVVFYVMDEAMKSHKNEQGVSGQSSYSCSFCLDSFINKHLEESRMSMVFATPSLETALLEPHLPQLMRFDNEERSGRSRGQEQEEGDIVPHCYGGLSYVVYMYRPAGNRGKRDVEEASEMLNISEKHESGGRGDARSMTRREALKPASKIPRRRHGDERDSAMRRYRSSKSPVAQPARPTASGTLSTPASKLGNLTSHSIVTAWRASMATPLKIVGRGTKGWAEQQQDENKELTKMRRWTDAQRNSDKNARSYWMVNGPAESAMRDIGAAMDEGVGKSAEYVSGREWVTPRWMSIAFTPREVLTATSTQRNGLHRRVRERFMSDDRGRFLTSRSGGFDYSMRPDEYSDNLGNQTSGPLQLGTDFVLHCRKTAWESTGDQREKIHRLNKPDSWTEMVAYRGRSTPEGNMTEDEKWAVTKHSELEESITEGKAEVERSSQMFKNQLRLGVEAESYIARGFPDNSVVAMPIQELIYLDQDQTRVVEVTAEDAPRSEGAKLSFHCTCVAPQNQVGIFLSNGELFPLILKMRVGEMNGPRAFGEQWEYLRSQTLLEIPTETVTNGGIPSG